MKQLFINRAIAASNARALCRPPGYSSQQEVFYTQSFYNGQYTFTIRPFNIEHDFSFAYDWICKKFSVRSRLHNKPVEQWMDTYRMMLQSDIMQPLVLLHNNRPVCLADVYFGQLHELSLHMPVQPTDYVIELLTGLPPKKEQHILTMAIQACLHYVYSFEETGRVLSEPNVLDEDLNIALQQSGFCLLKKTELTYKTVNVYEYSRAQFFQRF